MDVQIVDILDEMVYAAHSLEDSFRVKAKLVYALKDIVFGCINHDDEVYRYEQKGKNVSRF